MLSARLRLRLGPLFREIFLTLTLVFRFLLKTVRSQARGLLILKYLVNQWGQILFNRVFLVDVPKRNAAHPRPRPALRHFWTLNAAYGENVLHYYLLDVW